MILQENDKIQIKERLRSLSKPVKLLYFTQQILGQCQFCTETESLLKEVCDLSDRLNLEIYNFVNDTHLVEEYGIDKIPATAIIGESDHGIRFFGIPSGYEFATFLETLLLVSDDKSGLAGSISKEIRQIDQSIQLQVFATPTCPYCPKAALTAIQFAIENPLISASIVEISEFPHIAQKYSVMGVPKVVINETHSFDGALPEELFLEKIQEIIK
ncbi:thioredoxin family protein [candidate division KSB1 bacterium]|nr:thioredoxin family protein [candidate division KSB1 bacterium]